MSFLQTKIVTFQEGKSSLINRIQQLKCLCRKLKWGINYKEGLSSATEFLPSLYPILVCEKYILAADPQSHKEDNILNKFSSIPPWCGY